MSLFRKTVELMDEVEKGMDRWEEDSAGSVEGGKVRWEGMDKKMREVEEVVTRFHAKALVGEKDPNKRIYGDAMVRGIKEAFGRLEGVRAKVDGRKEEVMAAWDAEVARVAAEEVERKAAAEKMRVEEEVRKRKAEEEAVERARVEAEEEERRREEKKRVMLAEKERKMEEERKKKEEQEWRRKEEQERAMQEAKRKEEDEARVAAAARVQQEREQAVLQVSVKTVTGKNFVVPGVSRSATIAELKQKINDMFQIAKERQRMIFAGSILDDSGTIEQYKIQEGSFVHLVEKDPPAGSATASPRTAIAPSGKVEHIHQGKTQLDQILMACGSERLLVVDWSAPWCGPCRMIAPQFENLARQFPDVSFASVDTEASSENASLSRQEMIRAFPTFFFYRNMQKLHEFAGANLMMLNQKIDELRSPFPIPTSSSISRSIPNLVSGTITVPPGNTLVERVFNGLSTLKRSCSSNDFVLAVNTLITFLRNIVNNPSDPKYRRIRLSNMAFASRLGRHPGGINCMAAFGFQVTNEGGEQYLVMSDTAGRDSALEDTLRQLEAVVPTSDRAGGGSSSARSATNSASGATTSPSFGMPGAAGADPQLLGALMADPAIAEIFGDLMRDPQGMSELSSAMAAFQSGNMSALNSLSQNPRMRRLTELMMQNPIALQRISEAASRMGMPGHLSGSLQPQGPVAGNTPPPPAQHFDGEPTSAEEEERLLAEAIRLSMEDSNNAFNQGGAQGQKKKDGDDAAS